MSEGFMVAENGPSILLEETNLFTSPPAPPGDRSGKKKCPFL